MDLDDSIMSPPSTNNEHKLSNYHEHHKSLIGDEAMLICKNENVRQTVISTSSQRSDRGGSTSTPQVAPSQIRIAGDVSLTPTHHAFTPQSVNPHSSMTAVTPMSSVTTQAKSSIKLQNCVSTVSLGCELRLLDIYCRTRFSEYNPARFQGVVMKILEPRATALVFKSWYLGSLPENVGFYRQTIERNLPLDRFVAVVLFQAYRKEMNRFCGSGKIVCTGARNENDSYIATRKFARIIQKLGFPAKFLDFKIQNYTATADLRFPVRLEALQQAHGQFSSYEPELFPGLVYRMVRPRVVLLIFVNGKIVFTGGKSRNDISEALDIIYPILRSFRKN